MTTVLVTGASGWLGTRLVEALALGAEFNGKYFPSCEVNCLVLKDSEYVLLAKLGVKIFYGDIRYPASLKEPLRNVDVVFHLCGLIHPQKRVRDFFDVNTAGTRNILNAAIDAKVKRFIYMSSNSVAGVRKNGEIMTEDDIAAPYMAYGKSKHLAEQMVLRAAFEGRIEAVSLRTCWFYGPGQPERQTRFFRMIKSGKPIIFGLGKNLRSLSYIDNSVQGLLLAAESDSASGKIFWIADKRPYTMLEIYQTIAELLGVKDHLRPFFLPSAVSAMCRVADYSLQKLGLYVSEIHVAGEMDRDIACSIDKAERELNYKPSVELREGMERSIKWCFDNGMLN